MEKIFHPVSKVLLNMLSLTQANTMLTVTVNEYPARRSLDVSLCFIYPDLHVFITFRKEKLPNVVFFSSWLVALRGLGDEHYHNTKQNFIWLSYGFSSKLRAR